MKLLRITCLITGLCFSAASVAATVSFGLNQNDVGFDPSIDYATVTISNNAANPDHLDFVVDLNEDYFDTQPYFGIKAFYFNSAATISGIRLNGVPRWLLLANFDPDPNNRIGTPDFGDFNFKYMSIYGTTAEPLSFTLMAEGDSLMNYALGNAQGFAFAAQIANYNNGLGGTNGWFGGSMTQTPIPGAVWLFGTALVGLIGLSRRRTG